MLCPLLWVVVACSNDGENGTSGNIATDLVGTKWTLTNWDYSLGDDYIGLHDETYNFYFHSSTEGTFYYGKKDSYSDQGTTRKRVACHFMYSRNGNNIVLQYITDEMLSSTQLILDNDKLTAGNLEFSKGAISSADYTWLNTVHGVTGSCSWYSDMNGGLWIAGEGSMANYSAYTATPWARNERTPNKVVIEEGVTAIGSYAFANPSVGKVELPDEGLKQIGDAAFYGSSIETIQISQSTTSIGIEAFANCKYLKQINIPESIVTIGESAFSDTALDVFELEFGSNLRTIGRNAFYGGEASYLTFAEGVQSISTGAFIGDFCGISKELILPNSLNSIGATVFEGAYKKIVIGTGTTEIGEKAFISGATSGEMYVNRSIPPYAGDNIIVERTYWNPAESRWTLYVPKGCKSAYATKAPWNKFKSIIEDDSLDGTDGSGDAVNFPDANFKAYMVANFDLNKDGEISKDEASLITQIDCRKNNIQSLEGIEYCTTLTRLNCCWNQLTALDVSKNTALTRLECSSNPLITLDISKNTALTQLDCAENQLTTLDVSKTNLGNSTEKSPVLFCSMSTLQTLYLKSGWEIRGINVNRSITFISEQTEIRYKD